MSLAPIIEQGPLASHTSTAAYASSAPAGPSAKRPANIFTRKSTKPSKTDIPPPARTIRSRLLRIVFILVAPAIAGIGALATGLYQSERANLSQSVFTTAAALSSALDRDLGGMIAAARILAASDSLTRGDFDRFQREASELMPLLQGYLVVVSDTAGHQVVNTMHPNGLALPPASNAATRRKVFETGKPTVSDLFVGETSGRQAIAVYVPVTRDSTVKYTLAVGIPPSKMAELLQRQNLPQGWAAAIVDSSDIIVAHSRDPGRVGKIGPLLLSRMTSLDGLVEAKRIDGTPIYVGSSRSNLSGWTVAISVPTEQLTRQPNAILLYGGGGMLLILLAGLVVAARESARIAQAVQALIPAALALGREERPSAPRSNMAETNEVGDALERAYQLLQQRTSERDQATLSIAERSLADEMFRLAVEACPSGMVMTDSDGRIVMINSEIERLFGYARDELVGLSVDVLVPERLRAKHLCQRHKYAAAPEATRPMGVRPDLLGLRKDGTEFPIEVGLNPIKTGDEVMVLSVIVDISQRKRNERLKDEFVAMVSHELRTPLTSISGSLGLLAGQWAAKVPEAAARLVTIAYANSQRLVRLVNDILDIEKIEAGHMVFNMEKVELRSVVESAIEDNKGYAASFNINIVLDENSATLDVNADPDRLAQIVTNLLSNAIKFSPTGGTVEVAVTKQQKLARISVRDHGPGIPAEFKAHIFEKFAQADAINTRKKGGTGLGLSIVKQIVERLGGTVSFEDAPGGGTVFHVDLPPWDRGAGGEIDVDAAPAAPRVLFCEDNRDVATVVRQRLRRDGFAVDFAHTVATALARAEAARYDAILVDLQLPDGDGIGLIVRLRAQSQNRDTPVIVLSGDLEPGRTDVRTTPLNVLHWLPKPIAFKPLVQMLNDAIAPHQPRRPRVLHIDDDRDALALVAERLRPLADVVSADSAEKALQALADDRIDLVILDIALGEESGIDLLPKLRDPSGNFLPVIIFSNREQETENEVQVARAFSKMNSPIESLVTAVCERLSIITEHPAKETA